MSVNLNKTSPPSTAIVPYKVKVKVLSSADEVASHCCRHILESHYLESYKALHLGGKETASSRMVRLIATRCPTHSAEEMVPRIDKYETATKYLDSLTDEQFLAFLRTGHEISAGTGGQVLSVEIPGASRDVAPIPLIIKKIPLTKLEQEKPRSTSNYFELPPFYQYGVKSKGFGTWREVAALEMSTKWVLQGECHNFPLMYGSPRVVERAIRDVPLSASEEEAISKKQVADLEKHVTYWGGSKAVGARVDASYHASADVIVVMERLPQTFNKWMLADDGQANLTPEKISRVDRELNNVIGFMKSRGFLHFDSWAGNILSTDAHSYLFDFGLAISEEFDLSPEEEAFFRQHSTYDRSYVAFQLVENMIAAATAKLSDRDCAAVWQTFLTKGEIAILPTELASLAQKYKPILLLMHNFFKDLRADDSKSTPYPEAELAREWAKIDGR